MIVPSNLLALVSMLSIVINMDTVSAFGLTESPLSSTFVSQHHTFKHSATPKKQVVVTPMTPWIQSSSRNYRRSRFQPLMLADVGGGMEELEQMAKEGDKFSKVIRKGSPSIFKMGGYAAIPVSAILGAVIAPSPRIAIAVASSAITGIAGYIGKTKLDAVTEDAAKPALAQLILEKGLEAKDLPESITQLQDSYGVPEDDFVAMCIDVYKRYLIGMVKTPITKTSEMKELSQLRKALKLNNLSVGEAHAAAALEFYRQTCLVTPVEELEDPDHPDRMSMDKFLFLSERVFRQGGETDEAFKFEMSRVAKAFDVKLAVALDRVADIAEPFYRKALLNVRSKLDSDAISASMLEKARSQLGLDDLTVNDLHLSNFSDEVKMLLGKREDSEEVSTNPATLKFAPGSEQRLRKLQEILGLEDREANYEIYAEATPLFQAVALASMNEAISRTISPEEAWSRMVTRQNELLLKDDAMKDLLASMVMQAMGKPLEDTMTFAKVNNEAATYDKLIDALDAKQICSAVLQQSGWSDFDDFDAKFFDPRSKNSACGFLSGSDRLRLHSIFLTRAVRKSESGKELTEEYYAKVRAVQGMLGITDADEMNTFRKLFGPELQKTLSMAMFEIVGDDYTPTLLENMKEIVGDVIKNYRLSADLVNEYAAPLYSRAVRITNDKAPSGVPSSQQMDQLNALRDLLGLTKDDTYGPHVEVFGAAYKSGVLEAMGATGVIRQEFREPLVDLRHRLGVSDDAAKKLFLEAVKEKMAPMIEWIVLELERTILTPAQLSQKRQKDFGEDYFKTGKGASGTLGIGAEANIMTDCINLINFYVENDVTEKKEIGKKIIEKKLIEGDEEKIVNEEVPEYETIYPISALSMGAVKPEMAELLYRQFVVGGFTTQGPQGARYESARYDFGGILGLTKDKMEEIAANIGDTVYENFIRQSMQTKGSLDQQDMMFLANIQGKLNISPETGEKMLLNTQKKILSEEADTLLGDNIQPEVIKAFREKCNMMGMDLETDVGISKARLFRLFEEEISPALVDGEITIENAEKLSEIPESLGISPEEAEKIFVGMLDKRSKAAAGRIKAELLRGREENCIDLIHRLVRYAQFVNGDLALDLDEATAWKTYYLYDAMEFNDQDPAEVESNKSILKKALGLSS